MLLSDGTPLRLGPSEIPVISTEAARITLRAGLQEHWLTAVAGLSTIRIALASFVDDSKLPSCFPISRNSLWAPRLNSQERELGYSLSSEVTTLKRR